MTSNQAHDALGRAGHAVRYLLAEPMRGLASARLESGSLGTQELQV